MKKSILLAACLLLWTQSAAQDSPTAPSDLKSESSARWRSYGWTLGPVVVGATLVGLGLSSDSPGRETSGVVTGLTLGGLGIVVGPITGHNYAGKRWAAPGTKFRVAGLVFGTAAALMATSVESVSLSDNSGDAEIVALLIAAGVTSEIIALVVDFSTLRRSVDEYNGRVAEGQLSVSPTYNPTGKTPGLAVTYRF